MSWTDDNENAGNNAIRNLKVNGNIELVANYEIQDFIAVFDASKVQGYAYNTTAEYPYNADVVWDASRNAKASIVRVSDGSLVYTQNGGTPVVRSRESATLSGLNGLYQNGYRTTDVAFQYQFSTIGFTSATMYAGMAAKNMASANWKAQISTDGKSFADIDGAKWTITANVLKDDIAISLPESAMDKNLVTIRIVGDGDATLSTSYQFDKKFDGLDYCDHSETGFGNVFVLGTAKVVKDNDAPVVTSVLPTNGSTGTSSSGTITVSFNERIRSANLVNGKVTISGGGETKELEPTWNSRSVSFNYFNLKYGTTYNFVMPAGFAEDLSGNAAPEVKVEFTVMDRQKPAQRTFNAIVDHSLSVDKIEASADMPAQYRYIQDAIDDAPSASAKPYLIYIKEGYYKDPNKTFNASYGMRYADTSAGSTSTETVQIPGGANEYDKCNLVCVNKPNIHLIGQAVDKVTIAGDRLDGGCSDRTRVWYHINAGASMEVTAAATDFFMENVTLVNEAWTVEKMAGPQALALNMSSDRAVINNCNVRSYQDTYYSASTYNRQFWNNSTIEGAVDFIYGSGDVFFEGCTLKIVRQAGGYIVAPPSVHPETRKEYRWKTGASPENIELAELPAAWIERLEQAARTPAKGGKNMSKTGMGCNDPTKSIQKGQTNGNLFQYNPVSVPEISYIINSDGSITVTANSTTTVRILVLGLVTNLKDGEKYTLSGISGGSYANSYGFAIATSDATGKVFLSDGYKDFIKTSEMYQLELVVRAGQSWNKTFYPMICTASDWAASKKFVPYCPTIEDALGSGTQILTNGTADITEIGNFYCQNAVTAATVTNAPWTDSGFFGFVRRSVLPSERFIQIAFKNNDTMAIAKRRYTGTWQPWSYLDTYDEGNLIPDNANLNDYIQGGKYYGGNSAGNSVSNLPVANSAFNFSLEVKNVSPVHTVQYLTILRTADDPYLYKRRYYGGSWGSWYKFEGTAVT